MLMFFSFAVPLMFTSQCNKFLSLKNVILISENDMRGPFEISQCRKFFRKRLGLQSDLLLSRTQHSTFLA